MDRMSIKEIYSGDSKSAEFVRFCIVGVIATALDAGIFYLVRLFAPYQVALVSGILPEPHRKLSAHDILDFQEKAVNRKPVWSNSRTYVQPLRSEDVADVDIRQYNGDSRQDSIHPDFANKHGDKLPCGKVCRKQNGKR